MCEKMRKSKTSGPTRPRIVARRDMCKTPQNRLLYRPTTLSCIKWQQLSTVRDGTASDAMAKCDRSRSISSAPRWCVILDRCGERPAAPSHTKAQINARIYKRWLLDLSADCIAMGAPRSATSWRLSRAHQHCIFVSRFFCNMLADDGDKALVGAQHSTAPFYI